MFDSSSAAQAVMDACTDSPIHINWATRSAAAATLRAAADHVGEWESAEELRAIANELEGLKYGTYRCDLEKNE